MDTPSEVYRRSDADRVIECAAGDTFGIELDENATTGFRWLLTPDDHVVVVDEHGNDPNQWPYRFGVYQKRTASAGEDAYEFAG